MERLGLNENGKLCSIYQMKPRAETPKATAHGDTQPSGALAKVRITDMVNLPSQKVWHSFCPMPNVRLCKGNQLISCSQLSQGCLYITTPQPQNLEKRESVHEIWQFGIPLKRVWQPSPPPPPPPKVKLRFSRRIWNPYSFDPSSLAAVPLF